MASTTTTQTGPAAMPAPKACAWCRGEISATARRDAKFCGRRCRQASHRFGVRRCALEATEEPITFAYADPPYPGKAHLYPENQEVDHASLVDELRVRFPDGWALSTSSQVLRDVLALCPEGVRVGAWIKSPRRVRNYRPHDTWEPVIFYGGRFLPVDHVHDVENAVIARGRFRAFPGALIGMKPPAFAEWLFRNMGARPGDTFVDLFPGSGAVSLAWERFTAGPDDASRVDRQATPDAYSAGAGDTRRVAAPGGQRA